MKALKILFPLIFILFAGACQQAVPPADTEISPSPLPDTQTAAPPNPLPTLTPLPTATITTSSTLTTTPSPSSTPLPQLRFVVNGDTANHAGEGEMDTPQFFRGMVQSIASQNNIAFLVTVGDTTPPWETRWTIDRYLGEDFLWYPVVGNHELYESDMNWLRAYDYDQNGSTPPNLVNPGPNGCENTTYSFDYFNVHFVILNIYCDEGNVMRTDGAIVDHLYNWLKADLQATNQEHIFVFGHEPAFPQPDEDAKITRHLGDSLDQYPITRDRFWALLQEYHVAAYITGHTHSYSIVDIAGVWQVDVAHSMGARTQSTRSTYIIIDIEGDRIEYSTYRVNNYTDEYELAHTGRLR